MNLFKLTNLPGREELGDPLIPDRDITIERIFSTGQRWPDGFWYEQVRDEWVALLQGQAKLTWKSGKSILMEQGDWILIPAGEQHRVDWTSQDPPCIWLAVYGTIY